MEGLEGEEKKGEKVCIFHYGSFLEFARLRKVRVRQCGFSMECCIKRQQNEKTAKRKDSKTKRQVHHKDRSIIKYASQGHQKLQGELRF